MSNKRRRQAKSKRKKANRKLAEYNRLSHNDSAEVATFLQLLSSKDVIQKLLGGTRLNEADVKLFRDVLIMANDERHRGGSLLMHPKTYATLKAVESHLRNVVESQKNKSVAQQGSMEEDKIPAALSTGVVLANEGPSAQDSIVQESSAPPQLGERLLLLVLTKDERINIPGDLEEEFRQIAAKHGARYARLWYYKQVVGSAWPMIRKVVKWGVLASVGEWIRKLI